jgi:hypothetical protein
MRLKKLIKQFDFWEIYRDDITIGDDVRLNPETNYLQLKEQDDGTYSTDADLYAKTWVANPNSVKQWLGFEAEVVHSTDYLGDPVTSLNYRLGDGTDEYYWDGGAWIINTSNWNTEAEIANNISTFPIVERKIQVIINLVTADSSRTPLLRTIKILYSSDIEFTEDLVYRSLIPAFKSEIRPITDYPIRKAVTSVTIDLNDYPLDTPYDIIDIDSVFDDTNDDAHQTDLFQSYDSGTKIITLSAPIAANDVAWVRFIYQPVIAVTTSQEWDELEKIPAVVLSDINWIEFSKQAWPADSVANKSTGEAVLVPGPTQADIEFTARMITDKAIDHTRLVDEVRRFFANNRQITSDAMDEKYDICITVDHDSRTVPGQEGLHTGIIMFKIKKALFFQEREEATTVVQRLIVSGDLDVTLD